MDGLYEQARMAVFSVWRRKWLALAVAWGLCLAGWLAIALIPNSYQSKARVFVQTQSILPTQMGITPAERQTELLRLKQTLTSSENLEKIVRGTDLNLLVASDRDLAAQVADLRENIKIAPQLENPEMIEITATTGKGSFSNAQNARTANAIVQSLIDLFVEGKLAGNAGETGQTLRFLDDELARRERQLQEAEQRRVEFETRFMGLVPGQGSIATRMAAARAELAGVEQQLVAAQSSLAAMRSQLGSTPPTIATPGFASAAVGGAAGQLSTLEGKLAELQGRGLTDAHPDVVTTRAQIARMRPQAARESGASRSSGGGMTPNPMYASLRSMVAEREAQASAALMRRNQLQADMAQLGARQAAEPEAVAEQSRLNRDYEVLKRQYDKLLEDREQVRLRSDVQSKTSSIQFKVMDPPSMPTVPETPNRPLLLTIILFAAVAAGVGTAFAKGQLQTTFPSQQRLEQVTGLPVLGSVSEIFTAQQRAAQKQRLKWFAGAGGSLAGAYALLMVVEFWQRSTVA